MDYGNEPKYYLSQGYIDTLETHRKRQEARGNGFGYIVVNEDGIESPVSNTILATGGSGKERNLVIDPQADIPGTIVGTKQTPLNDRCIRAMTPDEWAKLQGFKGYGFMEDGKDTFSFPDKMSNAQRYKQMGNSVAIPLIEEIGILLSKILAD